MLYVLEFKFLKDEHSSSFGGVKPSPGLKEAIQNKKYVFSDRATTTELAFDRIRPIADLFNVYHIITEFCNSLDPGSYHHFRYYDNKFHIIKCIFDDEANLITLKLMVD